MKIVLLVLALGLLLAASIWFAVSNWDGSAMSVHGWVALALGAVLSIALAGGLMALVFFSARHGYDDRIEQDLPED